MKLLVKDYPVFDYIRQPLGTTQRQVQTMLIEEYNRKEEAISYPPVSLFKPSTQVTLAFIDGKYYIYQMENRNYYKDFLAVTNSNVVDALVYNFPSPLALESKFMSIYGMPVEDYNELVERVNIENGAVYDKILAGETNESYINEVKVKTQYTTQTGQAIVSLKDELRTYIVSYKNAKNPTKVKLLVGHTGIGKSSIIKEIVKELDEEDRARGGWGYNLWTYKLGFFSKVDTQGYLSEKTDEKEGTTYADDSPRADLLFTTDHFVKMSRQLVTEFKEQHENGELSDDDKKYYEKLVESAKTPVLFFDEINRANKRIVEQFFVMFSNKQIDSKKSYKLSVIIAACNWAISHNKKMEDMQSEMEQMYQIDFDGDGAFMDRFDPTVINPLDKSVASITIKYLSKTYPIKFSNGKTTADFLWDLDSAGILFSLESLDFNVPEEERTWKFPTYRSWEYVLQYMARQAQIKNNPIKVSYEFIKAILGGNAFMDEKVKKLFKDYEIDFSSEDKRINKIGEKGIKVIKKQFKVDPETKQLLRDEDGNPLTEDVESIVYDKRDYFLQTSIDCNIPYMMLGRHGLGKTFKVKNYAKDTNAVLIEIPLSTQDPATVQGGPAKKDLLDTYMEYGQAHKIKELNKKTPLLSRAEDIIKDTLYFPKFTTAPIPFEQQKQIVDAITKGQRVIIFFDEITRCDPIVQSAVFEAISEGRLLGCDFQSDKVAGLVSIVSAGNYGELYDVTRLDAASSARFAITYSPRIEVSDIDAWINYINRSKKEYHRAFVYAVQKLREKKFKELDKFLNIDVDKAMERESMMDSKEITSFRNFDPVNDILLQLDGYAFSFDPMNEIRDVLVAYDNIKRTKYFPANVNSDTLVMSATTNFSMDTLDGTETPDFKGYDLMNDIKHSKDLDSILDQCNVSEDELRACIYAIDRNYYDSIWNAKVGNNFQKSPNIKNFMEQYILEYFVSQKGKTIDDVVNKIVIDMETFSKDPKALEDPLPFAVPIYKELKDILPRNENNKINLSTLHENMVDVMNRLSKRLTALNREENKIKAMTKYIYDLHGQGKHSEIEKDIDIVVEVSKDIVIHANTTYETISELINLVGVEYTFEFNGDKAVLDRQYASDEERDEALQGLYEDKSGAHLSLPPILYAFGKQLSYTITNGKIKMDILNGLFRLAEIAKVGEKEYLVLGDLNNVRRVHVIKINEIYNEQVVSFTLQELGDLPLSYKLKDTNNKGDFGARALDIGFVKFNPYTVYFEDTNTKNTVSMEFYQSEYVFVGMSEDEKKQAFKTLKTQLKEEANAEEEMRIEDFYKSNKVYGNTVVKYVLGIKSFKDDVMQNILTQTNSDVESDYMYNMSNPVVFTVQNQIFQNILKNLRFTDKFVDQFINF